MRRREFIALIGGATAWPRGRLARAQQSGPMRRVGALMADSPTTRSWFDAFRAELEKLGWIEGRNLRIDHQLGSGPDFLRLGAEELAMAKPDVILAGNASALIRMKAATTARLDRSESGFPRPAGGASLRH
jgi:hypothetical protein